MQASLYIINRKSQTLKQWIENCRAESPIADNVLFVELFKVLSHELFDGSHIDVMNLQS